MKETLTPVLSDVRLECVLVQAWKKTAAYIRSHSWYADTLDLDFQSLRLPVFLKDLQAELSNIDTWRPGPLELVPAPKTQRWKFDKGEWLPRDTNVAKKLRPLAFVPLRDQVLSTALMLCLADPVETMAGDPRLSIKQEANRRRVLAYGHRLFCDRTNDRLKHRWGSSKLYRQYFQDYQAFLERPKIVSELLQPGKSEYDIAVVQSDLSKFYDRVTPQLLHKKVRQLQTDSHDDSERFFQLFERVFDWRWIDSDRAARFAKDNEISDFSNVALPQGLVASGFFANIVLRDFDLSLRNSFGNPLDVGSELILEDASYYVDDIRMVLRVPVGLGENEIEHEVFEWLQRILERDAPGLVVERAKTKVTVAGRERRFLVQQSKSAKRIQQEVSGAFDMLHGSELIGAIEGFFHTQQRYPSGKNPEDSGRTGLLVGMSDMRDDTATRFAASKFRRTFRSLRPLLVDEMHSQAQSEDGTNVDDDYGDTKLPAQLVLSKQQLDERAKLFAALLIEEWASNPSNVRLLRIAVDMYPDRGFLADILSMLRPGWKIKGVRSGRREVRLYCLAELFRAGATETGIVKDDDYLPADVSVDDYHKGLTDEANDIFALYLSVASADSRFPWYLMQQVFLYLAARNSFPADLTALRTKGGTRLQLYRQFARFLSNQTLQSLEERSAFLGIARTGFGIEEAVKSVAAGGVSDELMSHIAEMSPNLAAELWECCRSDATDRLLQTARRLGLERSGVSTSLADVASRANNPFYDEENLLGLAKWLFELPSDVFHVNLTPWQIECKVAENAKGYEFGRIDPTGFQIVRTTARASKLFDHPDWCELEEDRRKFQVGLLLRYALRGSTGFYGNFTRKAQRAQPRYVVPTSHWEQQRYSSFQGRSAFGPPWLPISSDVENLLFHLLRWPGAGISTAVKELSVLQQEITTRLAYLQRERGEVTATSYLNQRAPWPDTPPRPPWSRLLRVGIVQSIIPDLRDYANHSNDPELVNDPLFRQRHRQHLAAIVEGVSQMLRVRETHRAYTGVHKRMIDLLVFPELSVHPADIDTIILPFVRTHKCIVLCGQVYHHESMLPGNPLLNSCLWMIPEWSSTAGFQVHRLEQGKRHIAAGEQSMNPAPTGFRPSQWLINYQWSSDPQKRPLILTASVCYDATDLKLASELCSRSDLYIVCALNQDVGTFDRMSEGLHYHMYQGVIVVNNGQFGGSSFYMPFGETYRRQILHLHGQPQVSIAIAEISPQKLVERPQESPTDWPEGNWKAQPAAWQARP